MSYDLGLPGARVAFSTRNGGVSEAPYDSLNLGVLTDDPEERVLENRRRLAARAELDPARVAMGWQVHGTDIAGWDRAPAAGRDGFASPGAQLSRVDGHTTTEHQLGLLVLVADCLPVALAGGGRVAMLHCGWRPLAGGMIEKALEHFDAPPAAAVGPGIGRCCYEVGPEVLKAFSDLDGVAHGRMLDLRAVAERKLRAGGVTQIEHVEECTSCREDLFFSHRRDEGVTGRQGGVAWLTG
ncbi:MAG: laccase domain-containing protein [Thermoleophilaceae bacterium]|nr:laccase domain-containing protein [Thermoleophilaceae bacterium]